MSKPKLVVLTGAGISAESGLRTFRDSDGLWEGYDVTKVATPEAWYSNPQLVIDFYNMRRQDVLSAQPNAAHYALASLQEHFEVQVVTQNIDDLHERAGSENVLHLHGEVLKMRSELNEHRLYPAPAEMEEGCLAPDGGRLRPHVVWFGEPVPMIEEAIPIMEAADVFILVGTSLAVYPAAGLVDYVPAGVTKYVVDKVIPSVSRYRNVIPIAQTATAGMAQLLNTLTAKNI